MDGGIDAMSLSQIYENFVYRMTKVQPSSTLCRDRFRHNDNPVGLTAEQGPADRLFEVFYTGSSEDAEPTDLTERWGDHNFTVRVYYSATRELSELSKLILSDRHDILKALRSSDSYLGTSDATPSTSLGLHNRFCAGTETEMDNEQASTLALQFRCTASETEI